MASKRIKKTRETRRGLPDEGFARIGQVLSVLPYGESTWYRGIAEGRFPKPVKLGPRTNAWRVEDIREVIAAMAAPE